MSDKSDKSEKNRKNKKSRNNILYNITDSEWNIMKVLWKKNAYTSGDKISLGDITDGLKPEISWNTTTVRTFLARLAEKNIIVMEKTGRNYMYYAIAKETDCAIQEASSFLKRVFGGSPSLMFSALAENGDISDEERQKLIKIIENMENMKNKGRDSK